MSRPLLVHLHIFKNAGTTVDGALKAHFAEKWQEYDGSRASHQIGESELRGVVARMPGVAVLSSHQLRLPLPSIPGLDLRPMVFLRDPLDRARSVWSFERRQRVDSASARKAKELSVIDYIRWSLGRSEIGVIADCQVGVLGRGSEGGEVELDLATTRLAGCEVVGVVERMTESMLAAEHRLASLFPGIKLSFVSRNVDPTSPATIAERVNRFAELLGPSLTGELKRRNSRDAKLHELANRELDRRLAAIPDLEGALSDFQRRCRELAQGRDRLVERAS